MPQGLLPFSTEEPYLRHCATRDQGLFSRIRSKFARHFLFCCDRRKRRNFWLAVVMLCFCIYLFYFFVLTNAVYVDAEVLSAVPDVVLEKRLDFQSMTIDKMCSHLTSRCYTVRDKNVKSKGLVERHIIVDGSNDNSDTVVNLVPPKGETFDTSDTRVWSIDHTTINTQYVASLIVAPFLVSALSVAEPNVNKTLLEIGLGGGSLVMALNKMKPEINLTTVELDPVVIQLAEKWFGVTSEKNRHVIEGDGLVHVKNMIDKGEHVNAIVLDACDTSRWSPCPAATFRESQNILMMKEALTDNSVLVVNILSQNEEGEQNADEVIADFIKVFPSCLKIHMTVETNVILMCMPYSIGDTESQLEFYRSRLQATVSSLGLQYILKGVTISDIVTVV